MTGSVGSSWSPDQYEKFKAERNQPFFDLLAKLEPTTEAQVLDLGCGTGELTAELHRHIKASSTLGIDSSAEMLKKSVAFANAQLKFEQHAIEKFATQTQFDIIFSNAALQWCDSHAELFKRISALLKPHGQLAVQVPMNFGYHTHTVARELAQSATWRPQLAAINGDRSEAMLKPEEYSDLLYRLGFTKQEVTLRVYTHLLGSREDVVEWVKGTALTTYKAALSESGYLNFLSDYTAELFTRIPNEKPFFYPFKRLLLWAQK